MTAEEYLNEHCKPEDWNNLEECLKDSILTNNVIEHMERYAALRIHDVVGQSEQLPCEHEIDKLKTINGGFTQCECGEILG